MIRIGVGKVLKVDSTTILSIEKYESTTEQKKNVHYWYIRKEPVVIILCTSGEVTAYNMNAQSVSLKQILREFPDLEVKISQHCSGID